MHARQKQRKKNDPEKRQSDNLWWKNAFDQKYIDTYVDISTPESTSEELSFIKSLVLPKSKILDLGCGYGRHAIPLANAGYSVIGFDQSKFFLNLAKKYAKEQKTSLQFIKGDIRKPLKFRKKFDMVISMFTSFGYFSDVRDDIKVLKNISSVLRKEGILLLDLNNAFRTIYRITDKGVYNLKTNTVTVVSSENLSNGLIVKTKHTLDLSSQNLQITRDWCDLKGELQHYDACFTLYTPHEIKTLLLLANFEIVSIYGDFRKTLYTQKSPRMIVVAKKSGHTQ